MPWWNPFSKPSAPRRMIQGPVVATTLHEALRGRTAPNYRHIAQKLVMAVCDMKSIEDAAKAAYKPWKKDVWECEDIARAALNRLQERAANQGCSFAAGTLRANAPEGTDLHVYLWCLVDHPAIDGGNIAVFYDPTELRWVVSEALYNVDYTMT
jgi:hypothetical protein